MPVREQQRTLLAELPTLIDRIGRAADRHRVIDVVMDSLSRDPNLASATFWQREETRWTASPAGTGRAPDMAQVSYDTGELQLDTEPPRLAIPVPSAEGFHGVLEFQGREKLPRPIDAQAIAHIMGRALDKFGSRDEHLLVHMLSQVPWSLFATNADFEIRWVNDVATNTLHDYGFVSRHLSPNGVSIGDFLGAEFVRELSRLPASPNPHTALVETPLGPLMAMGWLIYGADGVVLGSNVTLQPVPEATMAQRVAKAHADLETKVRESEIGSWSLELQTGRVTWDHAAMRLFGGDLDEALLDHPLPPSAPTAARNALDSAMANLVGRGAPVDLRLEMGGDRWVRARAQLVHSLDGQPQAAVGVFQDISAQVREAHRLQSNVQELEALTNAIPDPLVRLTRDGTVLAARSHAGELHGMEVGRRLKDLPVDGELAKGLLRMVRATIDSDSPETADVDTGDGRILEVRAVPVADHGLCIIRDVTDQRKSEADLRLARERALEASRAKSMFLASMSHEIRTPMNGVVAMGELLASTELSASQAECVGTINTSARALLHIINDILDISKIEAGQLLVEQIPTDLSEIARQCGDILQLAADERGIALKTTYDDSAPRHVMGDPTRIRQVILNLAGNAVKFTERGSVWIRVKDIGSTEHTALIELEVEDTGTGIAADALESILNQFTQEDASTTRRFGGTGLGLTITKKLVELMRGEIAVRSEVGEGSCFTVRIPFPRVYQHQLDANAGGEAEEVHVDTAAPVLLVDDNKINRLVAVRMLEKLGVTDVDIAEDGLQALEAVNARAYRLILMDCQMPNMDGFEASHRIRGLGGSFQSLPIVALTANALKGDRDACLAAGMSDYLSKPVRLEKLEDTLKRWIPKS